MASLLAFCLLFSSVQVGMAEAQGPGGLPEYPGATGVDLTGLYGYADLPSGIEISAYFILTESSGTILSWYREQMSGLGWTNLYDNTVQFSSYGYSYGILKYEKGSDAAVIFTIAVDYGGISGYGDYTYFILAHGPKTEFQGLTGSEGTWSDIMGEGFEEETPSETDTTPPMISISSPEDGATTDAASITVTGTVADAVSTYDKLTVMIDATGVFVAKTVHLESDGSFSTTVPLNDGNNIILVTAEDEAGNPGRENVMVTRQGSEVSTPENVGPATVTIENIQSSVGQTIEVENNYVENVVIESEQTFTVNFERNQPVRRLRISLATAVDVGIQAQQLSERPAEVPEPPAEKGIVCRYLEIETTAPEQVENATIEFRVPKLWVSANDIDRATIRLLRYGSGEWIELPTQATGEEDNEYIYFSAEASGFSTFTITGTPAQLPTAPSAPMPPFWVLVIAALALVTVLIAVIWKYLST